MRPARWERRLDARCPDMVCDSVGSPSNCADAHSFSQSSSWPSPPPCRPGNSFPLNGTNILHLMPHDSQAADVSFCNHRETLGFHGLREDLRAGTMAGKAFANHDPQCRTARQQCSNSFHPQPWRHGRRPAHSKKQPARNYPSSHESHWQLSSHAPPPAPRIRAGRPPPRQTWPASEADRAPQTRVQAAPKIRRPAKSFVDR